MRMIDWFLNYYIVFSPKTRTAFKRPVISASPKNNSILKTILQVFISSVEQHSGFGIITWKHVGTQKISTQSSKLVVSRRSLYANPEVGDA